MVPSGRSRKVEDLLQRADREAIYSNVTPGHELLEELAGPIAPPMVMDSIDFGDSRFATVNKNKVRTDLRARHTPNKMGGAKDRRYKSR
jgi:hypothetical protein